MLNTAGLTMRNTGELFVANRFTPSGNAGSVARYLNAGAGAPTANGVLADSNTGNGFDFNNPHGPVFRGDELFVTNPTSNNILRFVFNGAGVAITNGAISDHLASANVRGAAINPLTGDLFVCNANQSSQQIEQWTFDSGGNSSFVQYITTTGSNNNWITFSPWGELFISEGPENLVARYTFSGNTPTFNGTLTGNGLNSPVSPGFSPWGELFVPSQGTGIVSRWTFDPSHVATANGSFTTPQPLAAILFPEPCGLAAAGALICGLLARRRRSQSALMTAALS